MINGLASALAEKELGATTVADIVRHAHVSKRTFYEHFADKRECFAALAMSITDQMLGVIDQAVAQEDTWEAKARAACLTYMRVAASSPQLTRTLVLEVQAGGPEALQVRRRAYKAHADTFVRLSEDAAEGARRRAAHQPRRGHRHRGRHQRADAGGGRGGRCARA